MPLGAGGQSSSYKQYIHLLDTTQGKKEKIGGSVRWHPSPLETLVGHSSSTPNITQSDYTPSRIVLGHTVVAPLLLTPSKPACHAGTSGWSCHRDPG